MRIVGGRLKGRKLSSFRGADIRPTSDKVREAVFNILRDPFENVLDLFAGTGAMGIEAVSRGAARAVFVDSDASACALIRKNLDACGIEARVLKADAREAVRRLRKTAEKFDLIIIDPPYGDPEILIEALNGISEGGLLVPGGYIVAEASKRAGEIAAPEGLSIVDRRRYGDTMVYFLTGGSTGKR